MCHGLQPRCHTLQPHVPWPATPRAMAGALAAQHFAPTDLTAVAVIGCGIQARWQLRYP